MIFLIQLYGLGLAVALQLICWLVARACGRDHWMFVYPGLLIVLGATLCLQATTPIPHLAAGILELLSLLAIGVAVTTVRQRQMAGWRAFFFSWRRQWSFKQNWPQATFCLCLGTELLYAAFPAYRYDQWNYHLLVAKLIHNYGQLTPPVLRDHVYFAGSFEYLPEFFRLVTNDDLVNQSATDAFFYLAWLIPLYGLVRYLATVYDLKISPWLVLGFCVFAVPEHEAIFSAKPDIQLFVYALLCLCLVSRLNEQPESRGGARETAGLAARETAELSALLGFYGTAPLAIKITWIHAMVALALTLLLVRPALGAKIKGLPLAIGAAFGALMTVPHWYKNWYFFRNPLHPSQIGPFHSALWGETFHAYWQTVSGQAISLKAYVYELGLLPWSILGRSKWFLPVIALGVYWSYIQPKWFGKPAEKPAAKSPASFGLGFTVRLGVLYLALWPLFYRAQIYDRFVFTWFAILLFWCLQLLRSTAFRSQIFNRNLLLVLCMLVPVVAQSAIDVRLSKMVKYGAHSVETFYAEQKAPYDQYSQDLLLNKHRREHFPGSTYRQHIVLSDSNFAYFDDMEGLHLRGPEYLYFWDQQPCAWHFVERFGINYLRDYGESYSSWPEELAPLLAKGQPFATDQRLIFLSPELISRELAGEPCAPMPPSLNGKNRP